MFGELCFFYVEHVPPLSGAQTIQAQRKDVFGKRIVILIFLRVFVSSRLCAGFEPVFDFVV